MTSCSIQKVLISIVNFAGSDTRSRKLSPTAKLPWPLPARSCGNRRDCCSICGIYFALPMSGSNLVGKHLLAHLQATLLAHVPRCHTASAYALRISFSCADPRSPRRGIERHRMSKATIPILFTGLAELDEDNPTFSMFMSELTNPVTSATLEYEPNFTREFLKRSGFSHEQYIILTTRFCEEGMTGTCCAYARRAVLDYLTSLYHAHPAIANGSSRYSLLQSITAMCQHDVCSGARALKSQLAHGQTCFNEAFTDIIMKYCLFFILYVIIHICVHSSPIIHTATW